jgi:hypothetical protein
MCVTTKMFATSLLELASDIEAEDEARVPPLGSDDLLPAKLFLDSVRFTSYKRLHAALKANPWIRHDKPSPQRLRIHPGDWRRYTAMLDEAGFDALDVSAQSIDAFMAEVRRRQEEIKQRKEENKQHKAGR